MLKLKETRWKDHIDQLPMGMRVWYGNSISPYPEIIISCFGESKGNKGFEWAPYNVLTIGPSNLILRSYIYVSMYEIVDFRFTDWYRAMSALPDVSS